MRLGSGLERWPVVLMVAMLGLTACTDDDPDRAEDDPEEAGLDEPETVETPVEVTEAEPVDGGTVRFGVDEEPVILNRYLQDGDSAVSRKVMQSILPSPYKIQPDFSFVPYLLDGEAEVTQDPFTVTYAIREEAVWSDGTPVTSDDLAFTYETVMQDWNIGDRAGYDLIEDYQVTDDRTITFRFSEVYAPWRLLFQRGVLPAHALEGEDFDQVWNRAVVEPSTGNPISAGPFEFDAWTEGDDIRLSRNEHYWGEPPRLDQIVLRFLPDTTALVQHLAEGEIDMLSPEPHVRLVEHLEEMADRVTYEVGAGETWEHLDFNTLAPGLDRTYVRQAIALGIDRETLAETLLAPIDPEATALHSPVYLAAQEGYEPHYARWTYDPGAAMTLLEDHGCEQGDDGVWVCDGDRLSFRIGTTGGNERRELAQQLIAADLRDIGIEITVDNEEGVAFFERLGTPAACGGPCDYDLALFSWIGTADPAGTEHTYGCDPVDGGDPVPRTWNWTAWCNDDATAAMDAGMSTIDEQERVELFNEAAKIMAEEVPVLPLFQYPRLLAWQQSITGPELNPTVQSNLWNADEWARTR